MISLVTIPSSTDMLASIGQVSSPMFDNLFPIAITGTGFLIGALLLILLINGIENAIKKLTGGGHSTFEHSQLSDDEWEAHRRKFNE